MTWKHGRTKPVIGIIGGIGAGKSTLARLFEQEGCRVIDSDTLAHDVLREETIKNSLRAWLGPTIFAADGSVDRKTLGRRVFADEATRQKLNALIHPRVAERRDLLMKDYGSDPKVRAVIWDSPLLVETGLHRECDAVVFVDTPRELRELRVQKTRGWSKDELAAREKSQFPLDKKAEIADYYIDNSGDEVASLDQVRRVLSQLLQ